MFPQTLRKLTLINSLVFLLVFLVFGSLLYGIVAKQLFNDVDDSMREKAAAFQQNKTTDFDPRIFIFWRDPKGEVHYNYLIPLEGMEPILPVLLEPAAREFSTKKVNNHTYRIYRTVVDEADKQEILAVTLVDSEAAMLKRLFYLTLGALVLGMLASLLAAYFLARRAFVPIQAAWDQQQQFVADASHELRTPLAVIKSNAELLLRHPERTIEEQSARISNINRETLRMNRLVNTLLTLARADADQIALQIETFSLAEVTAAVIEQFQPLAEQKQITLAVAIDEEILIEADRERLHQLLSILLNNALQYTGTNGKILLICKKQDPLVWLQVKDTGCGIAEQDLPYVFDRFYRGDKVRSRETGGTGLGLAIAKWIVDKHGGQIWVESKVGVGTYFHIRIPLQGKHA